MKKVIICALLLSVAFVSCKNEKAKEKQEEAFKSVEALEVQNGNYSVDSANSILNWKGYKPTGSHYGTVTVNNGIINISEGKITGGNLEFDMNSITVVDIPADDENNTKLVAHLKNEDFFDVDNNARAAFKIVEVINGVIVKGDLSIKGITKSIEFPVSLSKTAKGIELIGETFKIDRTDFNIKYKSRKFFENLKDKFIKDEFEISFKIVASK